MLRYRRILFITIILIMLINIFLPSHPIGEESTGDENHILAKWVIDKTMNKEKKISISANQGVLKDSAVLATSISSEIGIQYISFDQDASNFAFIVPSKSSSTNYWEISFSTLNYSNISFTASSWISSTAPRNVHISISTDLGVSWNDIPDTYCHLKDSYSVQGPTWNKVYLPHGDNKENILIRIMLPDNRSNPNRYSSSLSGIVIVGTPIQEESKIPEDEIIPVTPEEPEEIEDQDIPVAPEAPEESEDKDIPEVTEEPDKPEDQDIPEIPEVPDEPELPPYPEKPYEPYYPEIPVVIYVPYTPPVYEAKKPPRNAETSKSSINNEIKITLEEKDIINALKNIQQLIEDYPILKETIYKATPYTFLLMNLYLI